MKIFSTFLTANISKLTFRSVICIAKNFIWTTWFPVCPFHQRHRLFLGMVQRGVHFRNLWGGRPHLQPGCPCLTGQSPFCLNKLSYGFTWPTLLKPLLHLVYPYYMNARYQLTGRHPGHGWPWWLSLCLVYSIDSLWSYSHVSLGVESFHIIAWRDCTCSHSSVFDAVRVNYRKGTYSVTIATSFPWDMERVLRSWLCYELHFSVASFEEFWDAAAKRALI